MTTPAIASQTLGTKLKGSRVLAGLDQQQMADALGVGRSTISGWERDKFEPTASSMFRWAAVTKQPLDWFAEGLDLDEARPKGLEPLTFWFGAWSPEDDAAVRVMLETEAAL